LPGRRAPDRISGQSASRSRFFTDVNARASFENHRRYCARQGYAHEYVGASAIGWLQMRMILKYQVLLRTLRACAEGDLVLLLTQDSLLLTDIRCETLMEDRSSAGGRQIRGQVVRLLERRRSRSFHSRNAAQWHGRRRRVTRLHDAQHA